MDETKVLGLASESFKLAGSLGGIIYLLTLFNLYRNRVRVRIRILEEGQKGYKTTVRFEAQNLGSTATSIEPRVSFSGFLPCPTGKTRCRIKMRRYACDFVIDGVDRTLQPYVPVHLEAQTDQQVSDVAESHGFMFFKTYTFSFTRGRRKTIRLYTLRERMNAFQYLFRRFLVKVFGIYGFKKQPDTYRVSARSLQIALKTTQNFRQNVPFCRKLIFPLRVL